MQTRLYPNNAACVLYRLLPFVLLRACAAIISVLSFTYCALLAFMPASLAITLRRRVSLTLPQCKDALLHPYFNDLDKVAVDGLENSALAEFYHEFLGGKENYRQVRKGRRYG